MTAAERQRARLEKLLARVRSREAKGAKHVTVTLDDASRDALSIIAARTNYADAARRVGTAATTVARAIQGYRIESGVATRIRTALRRSVR